MDFFLFLLVNFTLFVRPAEIVPGLVGLPIYNYLILAAFAAAIPRLPEHLDPARLHREPITFCVLGLLVAVPLSHLAHFDIYSARVQGFEFSKSVIYYLVLISVVNTTSRLRTFLYFVALFTAIISTLAILQYYEYIDLPSISVLKEWAYDAAGQRFSIPRLRATGIFNDPNDLSMIAVAGFVISLAGLFDRQSGIRRFGWLFPAALLLATIGLTKSRGGVLALGAAIATLSYFRFGTLKTGVALALFLPVAGILIAGRESSFEGSTGEDRVELWAEGLQLMKGSPIFGIGQGLYADEVGLVAHNSFVHCFTELGLFGGGLFLGAFWFAGLSLWKLNRRDAVVVRLNAESALVRLQPYVLALLCGCVASLMTISRAYGAPAYLILGVANAASVEAQRQGNPPVVELNPRRLAALIPLSIAFLLAIYLFVKLTVR